MNRSPDASRNSVASRSVKQPTRVAGNNLNCGRCRQRPFCVGRDLSAEEQLRFSSAVKGHRVFHRGEHLYFQDDRFESIYLLHVGSVKLSSIDVEGAEQVLGFGLPGDGLGLDGISDGLRKSSAVALETVGVCEFSYPRLITLAAEIPVLGQRLFGLLGQQIDRDHAQMQLLSKKTAEQRLSALLLALSDRIAARGYAGDNFQLSMSRHDIGEFLGLALETVSRIFGRLKKLGVLEVNRRKICILDINRLTHLAAEPSRQRKSQVS